MLKKNIQIIEAVCLHTGSMTGYSGNGYYIERLQSGQIFFSSNYKTMGTRHKVFALLSFQTHPSILLVSWNGKKQCEMKVGRNLPILSYFCLCTFHNRDEISPVHYTIGYLLYHNYGTWRIGNHALSHTSKQ
jgi:hypothetical protein